MEPQSKPEPPEIVILKNIQLPEIFQSFPLSTNNFLVSVEDGSVSDVPSVLLCRPVVRASQELTFNGGCNEFSEEMEGCGVLWAYF